MSESSSRGRQIPIFHMLIGVQACKYVFHASETEILKKIHKSGLSLTEVQVMAESSKRTR